MTKLVVIPMVVLMLYSSTVAFLLHVLAVLFLWPISADLYWRAHHFISGLIMPMFMWLSSGWGRIHTDFFAKPEDWKYMGKESCLFISNHLTDADGFGLFQFGAQAGLLPGGRVFMKKEISYLPVFGWLWWMTDYIFLSRSFDKDRKHMQARFSNFRRAPFDVAIVLFVEGTRLTPDKLKAAQEFAASKGIHVPQHTLVPRPKGFVVTVESMRSKLGAVYDLTAFVPSGATPPKLTSMLFRKPTSVQIHMRRVPVPDLPSDSEGLSQWLFKAYEEKDALLEAAAKNNGFDASLSAPKKRTFENIYALGWSVIGIAQVSALVYFYGSAVVAFLISPAGAIFIASCIGFLALLVFGVYMVVKTSPAKKGSKK